MRRRKTPYGDVRRCMVPQRIRCERTLDQSSVKPTNLAYDHRGQQHFARLNCMRTALPNCIALRTTVRSNNTQPLSILSSRSQTWPLSPHQIQFGSLKNLVSESGQKSQNPAIEVFLMHLK